MILPATRPLEKFPLTSPLGVRFWDVGANRAVPGGLIVTATASHGLVLRAVETSSGAYAFPSLPKVRREPPSPETDYFSSPPLPVAFLLTVEDQQGRFLPAQFSVNAPVEGFFSLPGVNAGWPDGYVPLFSSPVRRAPGGSAVIRAQLLDAGRGRPAAWAMLEAVVGTGPRAVRSRGLADPRDGSVVIFLPYPESEDGVAESPPHPPRNLTDQSWPVQLAVHYEPDASPPFRSGSVPALDRILTQRAGTLLDVLSPAHPWPGTALRFGTELIVRGAGSPPSATLFVQPFV
ncbi:MAG TPA: hypothetical protein VG734_16280 [Lacunisphaera sp.]|nr:hypothetical protein [Lacunisphaera sp.]